MYFMQGESNIEIKWWEITLTPSMFKNIEDVITGSVASPWFASISEMCKKCSRSDMLCSIKDYIFDSFSFLLLFLAPVLASCTLIARHTKHTDRTKTPRKISYQYLVSGNWCPDVIYLANVTIHVPSTFHW